MILDKNIRTNVQLLVVSAHFACQMFVISRSTLLRQSVPLSALLSSPDFTVHTIRNTKQVSANDTVVVGNARAILYEVRNEKG